MNQPIKTWKELEQERDALLAQVEERGDFILGMTDAFNEYKKSEAVQQVDQFLDRTPQQSLDSLKARIKQETIDECVKVVLTKAKCRTPSQTQPMYDLMYREDAINAIRKHAKA